MRERATESGRDSGGVMIPTFSHIGCRRHSPNQRESAVAATHRRARRTWRAPLGLTGVLPVQPVVVANALHCLIFRRPYSSMFPSDWIPVAIAPRTRHAAASD